jgi:streptogramin lyase
MAVVYLDQHLLQHSIHSLRNDAQQMASSGEMTRMKLSSLRISPSTSPSAIAACLSLLAVSSLLSGCANMVGTSPSAPIKTSIGNIQGLVHGGRGPVIGANVYLYSPSLTGYGGSGIAASSLNASTPLLTNAVPSSCGAGATATATVDTNPSDSTYQQITGITVNTGGAGYTAGGSPLAPTVTITDPTGTGATATATLGTYNDVTGISVSGGTGYTAPVVTITPASTSACQDANGNYYVSSDANGNFALTGDYTCTSGMPVYIYTLGGNAGAQGAGGDGGFMSVLGICPSTGTLSTQVPYVNVNELTTVAAAYALAGFATDPLHIGVLIQTTAPAVSTLASLNALEMTGLTNAFNTAGNLYNVGKQAVSAPTTTPYGNGAIQYKNLNTLADVLANCVNSVYINYACQTLLSYTPGMTDTAGAAIYIAQHPASNVAAIFALATANGSPWQPILTAAPNDWTISITYTGGGIKKATYVEEGYTVAIDAAGNVWNANYSSSAATLSKFTNLGVPEGPTSTTAYAVGKGASSVAVDINGNVWTANYSANNLSEAVPTSINTATINTITPTNISEPNVLEFDGSGNMFIGDGNNYLLKASSTGTYISKSTSGQNGLNFPAAMAISAGASGSIWTGDEVGADMGAFTNALATSFLYTLPNSGATTAAIAFDAAGNGWLAAYPSTSGAGSMQKVTPGNTGTTITPSTTNYYPLDVNSVYVDGSDNVWVTDYYNGTIYEINATTNAILSGSHGFAAPGNTPCSAACTTITLRPSALQVDQSGNVWYDTFTTSIIEMVGAASPTVQPLAYATTNSLYGVLP